MKSMQLLRTAVSNLFPSKAGIAGLEIDQCIPHSPRCKTVNCDFSLVGYTSLIELRRALLAIDQPRATTAVVVLDHHFGGHLPAIVERDEPAFRLVLVSPSGIWSGSVGDLVLHSRRSGWDWIACERDVATALDGVFESRTSDENVVLFWPAWRELPGILGAARPPLPRASHRV